MRLVLSLLISLMLLLQPLSAAASDCCDSADCPAVECAAMGCLASVAPALAAALPGWQFDSGSCAPRPAPAVSIPLIIHSVWTPPD